MSLQLVHYSDQLILHGRMMIVHTTIFNDICILWKTTVERCHDTTCVAALDFQVNSACTWSAFAL